MNEKMVYMSKTKVIITVSKIVQKLSTFIMSSLPISKDEHKGVKAFLDGLSKQKEALDEDEDLNFLYLELKDVYSRITVVENIAKNENEKAH
jgi:hypothetical protein